MIRELAEILLVLLAGVTIGYTLGWMHERWIHEQLNAKKKNA